MRLGGGGPVCRCLSFASVLGLWVGLASVGGCGRSLLREGEVCVSSAECAAGLICDSGHKPVVCALTTGPRPDLSAADQSGVAGDLAPND